MGISVLNPEKVKEVENIEFDSVITDVAVNDKIYESFGNKSYIFYDIKKLKIRFTSPCFFLFDSLLSSRTVSNILHLLK